MIKYWENELYIDFISNCEGKKFDDIKLWVIEKTFRYEKLLGYGEHNFYLERMLQAAHQEIDFLKKELENK